MAPKISVLIYTARNDHPYEGQDWHCFDPFLRTLREQTFTDFELVLVDMLWDQRKSYFEENRQPFPVKHVPSKPNYWQDRGNVGLGGQINRGFIWADGELVWMGGENNMFPKAHLENVWNTYKRTGKAPVAWYGQCDNTLRDAPHEKCPVTFDLLGYTERHVLTMDHRAFQFLDKRNTVTDCHHQNFFGYSSVPLESALAVNGFDELMDGQWGLFDCDFGGRLDLHGQKLVMSRDIYVMEPPVAPADYAGITRIADLYRCNYAILLHNRATKRRVNQRLPKNYVDQVKKIACGKECSIKDKCKSGQIGESRVYPFIEGKMKPVTLDAFANSPVRELRDHQAIRRAGLQPYDRGTIVG